MLWDLFGEGGGERGGWGTVFFSCPGGKTQVQEGLRYDANDGRFLSGA